MCNAKVQFRQPCKWSFANDFHRAALDAGWSSHEKDVCLSNACIVRFQNARKICPDFYTIRKITWPCIPKRRMVGGATPSTDILGQLAPLERNRLFAVDVPS